MMPRQREVEMPRCAIRSESPMSSALAPSPATSQEVSALHSELQNARRTLVLTGAGCSTRSGIPDYRGPNGTWTKRRPMYYSEFIRSAESRRYFWARNYRGWPRFAAAEPNAPHFALAELENRGAVATLITQNVDDLHHRAGQQEIVALHGQSNRVRCLQCHDVVSRLAFQQRLSALNESWTASATVFHPDADAEIERQATTSFQVAACEQCDGIMKPDVVFFGESVSREVVERCMEEVIASDLLLVCRLVARRLVWLPLRESSPRAREAHRHHQRRNDTGRRAGHVEDRGGLRRCVESSGGVGWLSCWVAGLLGES
jgi:NAD-dependent SIR2 family protein deacetylase